MGDGYESEEETRDFEINRAARPSLKGSLRFRRYLSSSPAASQDFGIKYALRGIPVWEESA